MALQALKADLVRHLSTLLDQKVEAVALNHAGLLESRDSATKSSAGDKHETGRAMMQIELDNNMAQLAKARALRADFAQIDFNQVHRSVATGSLVSTNHGHYFIAIGLGKVEIDGHTVYVISMGSPLGMAMRGQRAKGSFSFQDKVFQIGAID